MNQSRRHFIQSVGLGIASMSLPFGLTSCANAKTKTAKNNSRPNILFIFTDDHAPHAIGAYGGWLKDVAPTPNINQLASQGALFENSFCTNSICGPSRAVILTGKHSHLNGFIHNGNRFDGTQQTFPKLMQKVGYQTAIIGKWHLKSSPTGFNFWHVLPGQGSYYNPDFLTPEGKTRITGYCTDITTDIALDWLKNKRDATKPFILMCQHKAPHRTWMPALRHLTLFDDGDLPEPDTLFDKWEDNASPARNQHMEIDRHMHMNYDLKVPPIKPVDPSQDKGSDKSGYYNLKRMTPEQIKAWVAAYEPKNEKFRSANLTGKALVKWKYQRYIKDYLRCIKAVDENVGRMLDYLKEAGLEENTIVIYSSDQGFYLGDHGWFDKRWMYEESLKMPLIVRWPGQTKPGTRITKMVQNLDYAETFLDIAGAPIPKDMQGHSLVPLLKGETPDDWRKEIYYHYYEFPGAHSVARHYGIRTERYKLMYFYQVDEWEFYDLKKDPDELTNTYNDPANASLIKQLKVQLKQLQKQYGDDLAIEKKQTKRPPPFSNAHGIADIKKVNNNLQIKASANGSFLLKKADKPLKGKVTFRCQLSTAEKKGTRNGMIAFAQKPNANDVIRAGVYIGSGNYVILAQGNNDLASVNKPFDKDKIFDVAVTVNLNDNTIEMTVDGTTVKAKLDRKWKAINYYGYGLNNTTTNFGPLTVDQ